MFLLCRGMELDAGAGERNSFFSALQDDYRKKQSGAQKAGSTRSSYVSTAVSEHMYGRV
jgi:hypothetical protein